jgi:hypothetical protein
MIQTNKRYWERNYKENAPVSALVNSDEDIDAWLAEIQQIDGIIHDELTSLLTDRSWNIAVGRTATCLTGGPFRVLLACVSGHLILSLCPQ